MAVASALLWLGSGAGAADHWRAGCARRHHDDRRFHRGGGDWAIPVAIFDVKPEYIHVSFDEMQKRYGTIEHYFSAGLGIDAAGQKALRDLYLEKN